MHEEEYRAVQSSAKCNTGSVANIAEYSSVLSFLWGKGLETDQPKVESFNKLYARYVVAN